MKFIRLGRVLCFAHTLEMLSSAWEPPTWPSRLELHQALTMIIWEVTIFYRFTAFYILELIDTLGMRLV